MNADKEFSGYSPSHSIMVPPNTPMEENRSSIGLKHLSYPVMSDGQKDSSSEESQDTSTSSLSSHSQTSSLSMESNPFLVPESMQNSQDRKQQKSMFTKRQRTQAIDSSLEPDLSFSEKLTGMKSGDWQPTEDFWKSQQVYEFVVIAPFAKLSQICNQYFRVKNLYSCTGESLELESPLELGTRQAWMLTLRILTPSSGMVTAVKNMLLLMNLEEILAFPISYDGLTSILVLMKSKAPMLPLKPNPFGLPQTYDLAIGIRDLMKIHSKQSSEDSLKSSNSKTHSTFFDSQKEEQEYWKSLHPEEIGKPSIKTFLASDIAEHPDPCPLDLGECTICAFLNKK